MPHARLYTATMLCLIYLVAHAAHATPSTWSTALRVHARAVSTEMHDLVTTANHTARGQNWMQRPVLRRLTTVQRKAPCQSFLKRFHMPSTMRVVLRFQNASRSAALEVAQNMQPERRIFSMIVMGFELPMLMLHFQSLREVVHKFLVSEARVCFQTRKSKPAVLTDALAAGLVPQEIGNRTAVHVVDLAEAERKCGSLDKALVKTFPRFSSRCFQAVQRYALLTLLKEHAQPDDLALLADVDEIAQPQLIRQFIKCAPFPTGFGASKVDLMNGAGMISLVAREFRHGMHCDRGDTWWEGPKLLHAGWILRKQEHKLVNVELFDDFRRAKATWFPHIKGGRWTDSAAWHLSGFGNSSSLKRKLTTFGAAHMFRANVKGMLDERRLAACIAGCVALLTNDGKPTPCLSHDKRLLDRYRNPSEGPTRAGKRLELPPHLLHNLDDYPTSWSDHLPINWKEGPTRAEAVAANYVTRKMSLKPVSHGRR